MAQTYPRKGGPYFHVIRFLDHPLLPATAGQDVPKIVKHGINDDGPMHPMSPHISAPDGVATLLYKLGREDWLQKFLDVDGTPKFTLRIKQSGICHNFYVIRDNRSVEIGLLPKPPEPPCPDPAVRYAVSSSGDWKPISQCNTFSGGRFSGGRFDGTEADVRATGETIAKHLWYWTYWARGHEIAEISWSGMTVEEREAAKKFVEEWKVEPPSEDTENEEKMSSEEEENEFWRLYDVKRRECRGGCGTQNSKHVCAECKETYYCSRECQIDDWKWHKSVCGLDIGI